MATERGGAAGSRAAPQRAAGADAGRDARAGLGDGLDVGAGWDAGAGRATDGRAEPGRRARRGAGAGGGDSAGSRGSAGGGAGSRGSAGGAGSRGSAGRGAGSRGSAGGGSWDPADAARDICLRLLSVRPRTRAELDSALRRRGVADEVVTEVLDRYADVGMIDDEAFARAWVTTRHHGRGLARRALAGELRHKGVAAETVGVALDEIAGGAEEATARTLVERRLKAERGALRRSSDPQTRRREEATLVRRLIGLLARKGYPPGLAYRVVKDVLAADAETADAADLLDLDLCVPDPDDVDQPGS